MTEPPPLGGWATADGFVGLVTAVADGQVTLLDPGQRSRHTVTTDQVTRVPAAAVRVTVAVDLPIPHGLPEDSLRRWMAMLTDPVLRTRAAEAFAAAGLDDGAALPRPTMDVVATGDGMARCLCGHAVPAAVGETVGCPQCGRPAATAG